MSRQPQDYITLGQAHADLARIREIANQFSFGTWLPERVHRNEINTIAASAARVIGMLMEAFDQEQKGGAE